LGKLIDTILFAGATLLSLAAGGVVVAWIVIEEALRGRLLWKGDAWLENKARTIAFYGGFSRFYDSVNPSFYSDEMRIRAAAEAHLASSSIVLDIGCGTGYTTQALDWVVPSGAVTGLDLTPAQLGRARRKIKMGKLRASLSRGDADHLPFPDASFDATVSVGALEHLPDPDRSIEEMVRVVRPGGRVVVGGPERDWFRRASLDRFLHSPARGELEVILRGAGLKDVGSALIGVDTFLGTAGYVVLAYGTRQVSARP